ncbi:MAG: hypothetical protein V4535_04230 [Bacteroidota bacterium]
MKNCLVIVSLFFIFSCSPKESINTAIQGGSIDIIAKPKKITENTNRNTQNDDTIRMVVEDGKGIYRADGKIDSRHSRIYVIFTNKAPGDLYAVVTPEKDDVNLRFNQILFPDKTADGPFGKDLAIKLNQIGEHTLIIGHSQMAENPYQGKFTIDLQVE